MPRPNIERIKEMVMGDWRLPMSVESFLINEEIPALIAYIEELEANVSKELQALEDTIFKNQELMGRQTLFPYLEAEVVNTATPSSDPAE